MAWILHELAGEPEGVPEQIGEEDGAVFAVVLVVDEVLLEEVGFLKPMEVLVGGVFEAFVAEVHQRIDGLARRLARELRPELPYDVFAQAAVDP